MSTPYVVHSLIAPNFRPTNKQRSSPYYAETPVVCGKYIRWKSPLYLTEVQFNFDKDRILRMVADGFIKLEKVGVEIPTAGGVVVVSPAIAETAKAALADTVKISESLTVTGMAAAANAPAVVPTPVLPPLPGTVTPVEVPQPPKRRKMSAPVEGT